MPETRSHSHFAPCLEIRSLSVVVGDTTLVRDVSLAVRAGTTHCLVGDSGSGKTMTSLAAVGLLPRTMRTGGEIVVGDDPENLLDLDAAGWARLRGDRIGYVGQNALGCLHPAYTIEFQLVEAIRRHQDLSPAEARSLALHELTAVDLPDPERVASSRPAQLSGGMCQRVALAIALCNRPSVLVADEPTTALDDATQDHVLDLIASRAERHGLGVLLITHDQDVVDRVADDVTTIADGVSSSSRSLTSLRTHDRREPAPPAEDGSSPVLEIESVSKRFERRKRLSREATVVLDDVSISAHKRQTVGLVGRSGAGKTTLAQIVAGIQPPSQGAVRIAGRPITGAGRVGRVEKASLVQYVFQDPFGSLNPRRSAIAQVAEPLRVQGVDDAEAEEHASSMLSSVGLSSAQVNRRPTELSGGQCQRVGLARALIRRPSVVVLDEPVSALDWSIRSEILAILADLQDEFEATYLLISHERPLVEAQCDEIYEIAGGAVRQL